MEKTFPVAGIRSQCARSVIWLGLGANVIGQWGNPAATLQRALHEIEKFGLRVSVASALYSTLPIGSVRQPLYLNMVIGVRGSIGPFALLRRLKQLEAAAGRRKRGRWLPRPLDLDILDFGGRIIGRPSIRRPEGRLVLPHPEMHRRGFVLVPLAAVAPAWRHPRLGVGAGRLLAAQPHLTRGIRRIAPAPRSSGGRRVR